MTITDSEYVAIPVRFDFDAIVPGFSRAVTALHEAAEREADRVGIDRGLRELVRLRASQLNGCAYCVDPHSRDARRAGVAVQRIDAVAIWQDSGLFTAAERAALGLAESVTLKAQTHVPDEPVAEAQARFGDDGVAALLALITAINAWNTIGVTARPWPTAVRVAD
ncbi:carboxymuconolactone decarboxylase family protein [Gryllotalpicola protaetiae]|uniref:Carboxymuconolactone decarboxylase family protein n=1 Tax=Gryllotalpicola protaetiae TaxID=2419771 RepID=A0A387BHL7_9MICO|nr:carboxymuconolactone decarboxylase family protein [Gryllotalpicola protaetiae]AYG03525.1 carboxymuconolactone decarboxylase family protein [Gryllotalpicola protaetiae]